MRHLKFWVRWGLQTIGIAAGAAAVYLVINLFSGTMNRGEETLWEWMLNWYPIYLLVCGTLVVSIIGISFFQVYISLLMAMNCTRREVTLGGFVTITADLLVLLGGSALLWGCYPDSFWQSGGSVILPFAAGAMLGVTSLFVALGVAIVRWGKIGLVLASIGYAVIGGCLGAFFALSGSSLLSDLLGGKWAAGSRLAVGLAVLAGGAVLYGIAWIFAFFSIRTMQVRA